MCAKTLRGDNGGAVATISEMLLTVNAETNVESRNRVDLRQFARISSGFSVHRAQRTVAWRVIGDNRERSDGTIVAPREKEIEREKKREKERKRERNRSSSLVRTFRGRRDYLRRARLMNARSLLTRGDNDSTLTITLERYHFPEFSPPNAAPLSHVCIFDFPSFSSPF